jgi:hypothetical protein
VVRVRQLLSSDEGGGARALGGTLLAIGVLVLLFRKTQLTHDWGELPVFLVYGATAALLYGMGFWGARLSAAPRPWQILYVVFGLFFILAALNAFVDLVGGNTGAPLNAAWIFLLTGVAGFAAALIAGVRVGCLLGALALIVSWLALWDELLDQGIGADVGTLRGLLVVVALILLVVAALVAVRGRPDGGGSDVVTAAGIAAVAAGAISIVALAGALFPFSSGGAVGTNTFWDSELLVASLLLLLYASASGVRGPGYVGAFGVLAFAFVVGFNLDDPAHDPSLVGWPLVLLLAAAALLVVSILPALRRARD